MPSEDCYAKDYGKELNNQCPLLFHGGGGEVKSGKGCCQTRLDFHRMRTERAAVARQRDLPLGTAPDGPVESVLDEAPRVRMHEDVVEAPVLHDPGHGLRETFQGYICCPIRRQKRGVDAEAGPWIEREHAQPILVDDVCAVAE